MSWNVVSRRPRVLVFEHLDLNAHHLNGFHVNEDVNALLLMRSFPLVDCLGVNIVRSNIASLVDFEMFHCQVS